MCCVRPARLIAGRGRSSSPRASRTRTENVAPTAGYPPFVYVGNWSMAGTQVDEIDATLLTLKGISDRPVWSEQFRASTVPCQSQPAVPMLLT
jgi:hypothetical protein